MNKTYVFSAPGRTEIGGNHTDHQSGCVLAAAVNLEIVAEVIPNNLNRIRIKSDRYMAFSIDLADLNVHSVEKNTAAALVRGVAAAFVERGAQIKGFDAIVHSNVIPGRGLGTSAAFTVLIGTILNEMFCDKQYSKTEIAQMCQYAEKVFFGKLCGLMNHMISALGGMVFIDFENAKAPKIERLDVDLNALGYALCIIDCGANHIDLANEYETIPGEMKEICNFLGKEVLREIPETEFFEALPKLRKIVPDRAILRAIHIYQENKRVIKEMECLKNKDLEHFFELVKESGRSSWMYLQNIIPTGAIEHQEMGLTLALCDVLLKEQGAYRVHGDGFIGTVQAYVPIDKVDMFKAKIENVLGKDSCQILNICSQGGVRIE